MRIDIPTDQEAWLLPRVRDLVNGPTRGHAKENDNKKVENESKNEDEKENDPEGETRNDEDDNSDHFRYLRLVGTVSQDVVDECLVLRSVMQDSITTTYDNSKIYYCNIYIFYISTV